MVTWFRPSGDVTRTRSWAAPSVYAKVSVRQRVGQRIHLNMSIHRLGISREARQSVYCVAACHGRSPMTSFSMRALLPVSILIGLSSACAHRNTSTSDASPPASSAPSTSDPHSTVTSEEIAKAPGQSVEQVLMGRFPGVEVSRTSDGGFAVRIRGGSSFQGGNNPLYVIDGVAVEAGADGDLRGINPNDIASIQVL